MQHLLLHLSVVREGEEAFNDTKLQLPLPLPQAGKKCAYILCCLAMQLVAAWLHGGHEASLANLPPCHTATWHLPGGGNLGRIYHKSSQH